MKNTIKAHRDFHFDNDAPVVRMPAFVIKHIPKRRESGEYGLVVPKRVFPLASMRNWIKRHLREWIYAASGMPKNRDCLVIARTAVFCSPDGPHQMRRAIRKIEREGREQK